MSQKTYFDPADLKKFGSIVEFQEQMGKKFFEWYGEVFKEGALTEREKALIALAVAHAVQCPYCIDAYSTDCLQKGADEEQMMEAVHVAAAIKGGATLVFGVQMMNHVKGMSM
jgi:alkylhydroperoxidase/carboxymuconolactone decarboxylase family protein